MLQIRELLWGLLLIGCAAASIQVQILPHYGEISVGASKFFVCEVVGEVKDIDWFDPSGEKILPNRQDISVSRTEEASTLVIYKANMDNAGIYTCVAKDGEKEARATVRVTIYQKITFQNAPSPQEFNEGDDADIICDIVSSPPPTIVWKYKGFTIQFSKDVRFRMLDNGHLQIRGIKKTDEGVYNCEARVAARGEIDYKKITVVVNVFPTIRARQSEVNATADIGSSTMLACDADGFPDPIITWAQCFMKSSTHQMEDLPTLSLYLHEGPREHLDREHINIFTFWLFSELLYPSAVGTPQDHRGRGGRKNLPRCCRSSQHLGLYFKLSRREKAF